MQQETGMDRRQNLPQLKRLHFLGQPNQAVVAAYLKPLQARQDAPATLQTPIDGLNSFCRLGPAPRQLHLYQDLASTIKTILKCLHRFLAFLQDHGRMPPQPLNWRRHRVLVPHTRPKPVPEDDLLRLFRVIDRLRDRTMFLRMLRGGLRVGAVSALTWPAINCGAGSIRINNRQGQVDRVVS
jgi:integrase